MTPWNYPEHRMVVTAFYGNTKRYYLCLFTTQARIFEIFYEELTHYPLQMEVQVLDDEAFALAEDYYRSTCHAVIEGE